MYADAWQKRCDNKPVSPLEALIADVIEMHPEYHNDVMCDDLDKDYNPDGGKTNPRFCIWGCISASVNRYRPTDLRG
jgi:hypothetical protein